MKALLEETRQKTLELLRQQRSQQEISDRTGICIGTIQDWAAEWRKDGTLAEYTQAGSAFVARAQRASNGYYKCIRKRYNGMKWTDQLNKRVFGFDNVLQSIPYYLKDGQTPTLCLLRTNTRTRQSVGTRPD